MHEKENEKYLVYHLLFIGACACILSLHGQYSYEGERVEAPEHVQKICHKLLNNCDLTSLSVEDITIYVQRLPAGLYAYVDKKDMSITINEYYCMESSWFTWLVSFGFPFVFYHEVIHLQEEHCKRCEGSCDKERELVNLYCEMEADLGSFQTLLQQKQLLTLVFCLGKITLDALLNVQYEYGGQPSARERCLYWWGFCKEYVMGNTISYKNYAQRYLQELKNKRL